MEDKLAGGVAKSVGNMTSRQLVHVQLRPPMGFPQKGYDGDKVNRVLESLEWLGFFDDQEMVARCFPPMEALTALMQKKLSFDPKNDWDAVYMHHVVEARFEDGTEERHDMTFSSYGKRGGVTAISATVGKTVAIAAELVMYGKLPFSGVLTPMRPEIYRPCMQALKDEGFRFIHRVTQTKATHADD